jgi:hypothetical protein
MIMDIDDSYETTNPASDEDNKIYQSIADNYIIDRHDEIQSLRQQLAVKDLEVMRLREALEACKYDCNTGEVIGIAEKALSTTFAPEQLMAWYKEQLGQIVAYRVTHIDGGYELNFNESWQKVKNQEPLYAPKLDAK